MLHLISSNTILYGEMVLVLHGQNTFSVIYDGKNGLVIYLTIHIFCAIESRGMLVADAKSCIGYNYSYL